MFFLVAALKTRFGPAVSTSLPAREVPLGGRSCLCDLELSILSSAEIAASLAPRSCRSAAMISVMFMVPLNYRPGSCELPRYNLTKWFLHHFTAGLTGVLRMH